MLRKTAFGLGIAYMLVFTTSSYAKEDPHLFAPYKTTGGNIGMSVGGVIGGTFGGPAGVVKGALVGCTTGHAIDRTITRIANDVTGPAWRKLERSCTKIFKPRWPKVKLPRISF